MQMVVMEYAPDGVDFVKVDGKVATFSMLEAKRVQREMTERTGYLYSVMMYTDDLPGMVRAAELEMVK